jgi:hypothetical protein
MTPVPPLKTATSAAVAPAEIVAGLAVKLVMIGVAGIAGPLPPLPQPAAVAVTTNMCSTASFAKTEHTLFNMGPPV